MKRTRFSRRGGLTRDAEQLITLAQGLAAAGARLEIDWWESQLNTLIERLLRNRNDDALTAALDRLYETGGRAYDAAADLIEAGSEAGALKPESADAAPRDVLLFAAPILAWSRYAIVSGPLPESALVGLRAQLHGHVLAANTQLALADFLWSPDQLPRGYADTFDLTRRLALAASREENLHVEAANLGETTPFLSDLRYVVGAIIAPHGEPIFRWQEDNHSRESVAAQWTQQGGGLLATLFPACATEPVLPDAYHAACRHGDRASRPYSLKASVAFLQTTLSIMGSDLRVVIAPFHDRRLEEYRIAFTLLDDPQVLHGVVWPLLDAEDETTDVANQIEAVLREAGVGKIITLDQRFPMEYCDDCGAPLYPDPEGEPVHAEMPEDDDTARPTHLH